jgi:molybdopterin converting factor small subunit
MERIEQLKKVRMIEALDLTEDQSVRFFARLHEHNKAKEDLHQRKMTTLDKLERMLRNEVGEDELRTTFPEVKDLDQEMLALDAQFFDGLSDILSEDQRARLLLFERQFQRELQDALQTIQRRRHGPGSPD